MYIQYNFVMKKAKPTAEKVEIGLKLEAHIHGPYSSLE